MAWRTVEVEEQRIRFVVSASRGEQTMSSLCTEFGISRPTGYLWLRRYRSGGVAALAAHSRRPHSSPARTAAQPAIFMPGTLRSGSGNDLRRVTRVNVAGVRESFWELGKGGPEEPLAGGEIAITAGELDRENEGQEHDE